MAVGGTDQVSAPAIEIDLRETDWGWLGRALDAGGEMGRRIRAARWDATALGPPGGWSTSLQTALALVLTSRFPMRLFWGPELVMLYNDAYSAIPGDKHPACLGRPAAQVWPEIWDDIGPMLAGVVAGGPATWSEDRMLVLDRYGYPEECYFTFSYSPVIDDDQSVGGVIAAVHETTGRVLSERRLRTLRSLAERVAAARSREEVCTSAVEAVVTDGVDVPFAAMYLVDDERRTLVQVASSGTDEREWPDRVPRARDDEGPDLDRALWTAVEQAHVEQVSRSLLLVPVVCSGYVMPTGVLALCASPHRQMDTELRAFVDLVARHVATCLGAQEHAARRQALADASLALSRSPTLGSVLDTVAAQARTLVGARRALVRLVPRGRREQALESVSTASGDGVPHVVPQAAAVRGVVVALVGRQDTALGHLEVTDPGNGTFVGDDEAILVQLARMASVRIENTRLYERERDVAVALQRSLLPQATPAAPGLVVASRYLPGADGTEVGGDWYDVIELPGRRTGLVIGDVLGRGVRAAAVMGQLRAVLRAYALEGLTPAALLTRLDVVLRSIDDSQLTTCTYAVFDPSDRSLTLATAGHLPPLALTPQGEAVLLALDPGLPLGVGGHGVDPGYTDTTVHLAPGGSLMLFTDGLVEGRQLPVGDGLEMLREAMHGTDASPEELCDRALQAMGRDLTHDDDTALLAVRLLPGDSPPGAGTTVIELAAPRPRRFVRASSCATG